MDRYCTNCKKDFDFSPREITGRDELICPECGCVIAKNSWHPSSNNSDEVETGIGNVIAGLFHLSYIFYLLLAIVGIICYFTHLNMGLYIATGIALAVYLGQLLTQTTYFTFGIVLLPVGAIAGYLLWNGLDGGCLGVLLVFLCRHVIRDIFWGLIRALISASK